MAYPVITMKIPQKVMLEVLTDNERMTNIES